MPRNGRREREGEGERLLLSTASLLFLLFSKEIARNWLAGWRLDVEQPRNRCKGNNIITRVAQGMHSCWERGFIVTVSRECIFIIIVIIIIIKRVSLKKIKSPDAWTLMPF